MSESRELQSAAVAEYRRPSAQSAQRPHIVMHYVMSYVIACTAAAAAAAGVHRRPLSASRAAAGVI